MAGATGGAVHVRALDGLRGLSVLGVIAFHLASLDGGDRHGLLGGGWLGVDVFFTLSGYLITSLLLVELRDTGRIDLRAFWRRRIRRLQPAALVAVCAITAAAVWWSPAGTGGSVRSQAVAAVTGVANWQSLWADRPYAAGTSASAFEHFWSLAVEEQFYLVWPLVFAGIALAVRRGLLRRPHAAVLGLAGAGVAVSWVLLVVFPLQRAYVGTDARMGSILLGVGLAALLPIDRAAASRRGRRRAGRVAAAGLAVTAVLWLVAGWPPNLPVGLVLPVQGLATVAVLAGLLLAPASRAGRLLSWWPLTGAGKVSYGLYLWHWPVFVICTPDRLGIGGLGTTVVRLVLVGALTAVSWVLVERPVRLGILLPSTRLAFPVAFGVALAVAVTAVRAVAPEPAWAQADGSLVVHEATSSTTSATRDRTRPQRVLVVGDSIATSLLAEAGRTLQVSDGRLLPLLAERGISAASATISGCPVTEQTIDVDGELRDDCVDLQRARLPAAMEAFHPDLVVWYSRQDVYPSRQADGTVRLDQLVLRRRYESRVRWFAERGAKVLFVSPGPNADGHDAAAPLGSSKRSMALLDRNVREVAGQHPDEVVGIVPMAELLCGDATDGCPDLMLDGRRFRPEDGVHFGATGDDVASEWLADRIAGVDLSGGGARSPR